MDSGILRISYHSCVLFAAKLDEKLVFSKRVQMRKVFLQRKAYGSLLALTKQNELHHAKSVTPLA
jgi:hypothetical protein